MKIDEKLNSSAGPVTVALVKCDHCGRTRVNESSWKVPHPWSKFSRQKNPTDKGSNPPMVEMDFCSDECLIMTVQPGLLDVDPHVVADTIRSLKTMVQSLDG